MKTYRTSFLRAAAFVMLLCSTCIVSRKANACPDGIEGPTSFTAAPGGSQSLTWTAHCFIGADILSVTLTGSDVFTLSQMPVGYTDSTTFTITFTPGANATGTFKGSVTCGCKYSYELVGNVSASGVADVHSSEVSVTVSPNPATNHLTVAALDVRSVEIGIYDLLGKKIASSKLANWEFDASSIAPGPYIVHLAGESLSGDPFIVSRRIIIER